MSHREIAVKNIPIRIQVSTEGLRKVWLIQNLNFDTPSADLRFTFATGVDSLDRKIDEDPREWELTMQ